MGAAPAVSHSRVILLGAAAFLWLLVLLGRLVHLQVFGHAEFARRARQQQQRTLEITPKRGVIYDRHRRELAVSIGVDSVFAVPPELNDPDLTARLLAPVLGLDPPVLAERLRSDRSFVWVKRQLDAAEAERVRALKLSGIYFQREHKRFYPKRELAAHVLGFVGLDENGLAGIEYALDDVIRGRPRRLVITADGRRRWFERRPQVPEEGASVVLTLDESIQYIAERELAAAIARTGANSGTVIVQEPHSGEILALANYPTFNPNDPTAVPTSWHLNPALSLAYEPGSTFKVVTVAAALVDGLAHPEEVIDCQQGSIMLAGHRIRDHKPFGGLSLREVIYESSDVGAIKVALRLGNEKMYEHIRRWHFGEATGIELPAESPGLLRPVRNWSRISIGAIAMGQELAITTLQLAAATSAIANGGTWVQPRVVKQIFRGNHAGPLASARRERIIPVSVAEELRRMLAGVVSRGTGQAAQPVGYSTAGKTGTAEKIDESGTYSRTDFVASFAGFAPVDDPVITVVVVLDSPRGPHYHGGEVAAPVFRTVVERVLADLGVPPDLPVSPEGGPPRFPRPAAGPQPGQYRSTFRRQADSELKTQAAAGADRRHPSPSSTGRLASVRDGRVVLLNGDTVAVPDFTGLSLRAASEKCSRLGLEPVLSGSGVAVDQHPPAGSRLPRGSRIELEFRPALPSVPTRSM